MLRWPPDLAFPQHRSMHAELTSTATVSVSAFCWAAPRFPSFRRNSSRVRTATERSGWFQSPAPHRTRMAVLCLNIMSLMHSRSTSIYIAHYRPSASNALNVPNTAETSASSIGDRSWRCWVLDHAGRCSVRSRRSDQPRRTHDGRTYRAVFSARRVGGGWPNVGAVVWRLGQPAYTARTGSPGHVAYAATSLMIVSVKTSMHTELERDPICHIKPAWRSCLRPRSYILVPLTTHAAAFMTCLYWNASAHFDKCIHAYTKLTQDSKKK